MRPQLAKLGGSKGGQSAGVADKMHSFDVDDSPEARSMLTALAQAVLAEPSP